MNNYYQPAPNPNVNPYQQNVDIIKGFFKKPVVLASAILQAITVAITLVILFISAGFSSSYASVAVNRQVSAVSYGFTVVFGIIALIPSILIAISWFGAYFKSKNPSPASKPLGSFKVLWVISIVLTVFIGLSLFVFLIVSAAAAAGLSSVNAYSYYYYSSLNTAAIASIVIAVLIFLTVILAFSLFFSICRIRYYHSVKNSMQSIYLNKKGAAVYGVLQIVFSVLSLIFSLIYCMILFVASNTLTAGTPVWLLMFIMITVGVQGVAGIIDGVIAVRYAGYISGFLNGTNQDFNANQPYNNPMGAAPNFQPVGAEAFQQNTQPYSNPYINNRPVEPKMPQQPISNDEYQQPQQSAQAPELAHDVNPQEQTEVNDSPQNNPPRPTDQPDLAEEFTANVQPSAENKPGFCPNCGSAVFRSDMFCNNCGTKLK